MTTRRPLPPEWNLDVGANSPYDPERYYIFFQVGTDTTTVAARISQPMNRALGEIMELALRTKAFPYRSTSDLIRDAVIHRLFQLLEMIHDPARKAALLQRLAKETALDRLLEMQMESQRFKKLLEEEMVPTVDSYLCLGAGGVEKARGLLQQILTSVDNLSDPFWQTYCRGTIIGRYGQYLDSEGKDPE